MANLVKGEGPLNAKIYIIGEAPGKNEDEKGRPFCGGAGMVLNGLLEEANINRTECYVDNVVQYQPDANNFGLLYEDSKRTRPTKTLMGAHERIRHLVKEYKPNVVIAMGNESLYAFTQHKQITKWRGSLLNCRGVKVIPTIHPAMIMRQYEYRVQSLFDLSKAKRESHSPNFPVLPKEIYTYCTDYDLCMATIDMLMTKKRLTFDIETAMDINQILCIGFAWNKQEAICIPIFHGDTSFWTPEQEVQIIKRLRDLFQSDIEFVGQNGQFDMSFLWKKWGISVKNYWLDTMILHHCIYPELPKSLGFLTSIYTVHPYHKDIYKGGSLTDFWKYNCIDCLRTYEIADELIKEAKEFNVYNFYRENSHKLIIPLFTIQNTGILIDVKRRRELDISLSNDLVELQKRLDSAVEHPINVASPKQMKELLYEEFKFPPIYKTVKDAKTGLKKKVLTADDDALDTLDKRFPGNPMFQLIREIRGISKLLNTYVRAPLDEDERIRCSYAISGTKTGRLSSRASVFGTGTNLQNIPRGELIRGLFIPKEGYKFVNVDLSQAEARVVAHLAKEKRLQTIFDEGGDVHKRNASIIFKRPLEQITYKERYLGKMLVHASNYGIGASKFAQSVRCTKQRAQELLNTYHANYPRIKRWHDEVKEELRKTRILITPMGRKRMFFDRWGDDLFRDAIAHVPQSTVGDLLNRGLVNSARALPNDWKQLLQVHDSVLFQVPEYTENMYLHKFMHHYFEIPITIHGQQLIIPIDIEVGDSWGNLKKLEV